jgi:hypothetical protein
VHGSEEYLDTSKIEEDFMRDVMKLVIWDDDYLARSGRRRGQCPTVVGISTF